MTFVRFVPFGPAALDALRGRIAAARTGDTLAPVTVAVPTNYAGLWLRRELAAGGLVNVRFLVLPRAAELLGAPALAAAGRTPLTPALRAEAIRVALDRAPGIFRHVARHAATERALDATFRELRDVPPEALATLAAQGDRARDVVSLYRAFEAASQAYYDETDISRAAVDAVRAGAPALRDLGHVVIYLPRRLAPAEAAFVAELGARDAASVILGLTGDASADREALQVAAALGHHDRPPTVTRQSAGHVIVAPDVEEEARTVIRAIVASLAKGASLRRTAILYASEEPHARVLHEQLAAAGIPFNGPASRKLAETVPGRHLARLVALRDGDMQRDLVTEWLTSAPVRETDGRREAPSARWDALSREAGVVRGRDQWAERLARQIREFETRAAAEESQADGTSWLTDRNRRDAETVQRLLAFVEGLAADLVTPDHATWDAYATWALRLQRRYLGAASELTGDGGLAEATEAVEAAIDGLRALDRLERPPTWDTFARTVAALLEAPLGRAGAFGTGVFVGPIGAAAGLAFDTVYLVGLVEGRLPSAGRDDPLLPAEERETTGGALAPRERVHEQRRDYLVALAAGARAVVSYARSNLRGQRKHLPSRWLVESVSALAGRRVRTADVPALHATAWLTPVASFEDAIRRAEAPLTLQEARMRRMASGGLAEVRRAHPVLARGIDAGSARLSPAFTRWDGFVGAREGLGPTDGRPASPTSLEIWAKCPMQYYLRQVLRVAEFETPAEEISLSPRDRGSLIHGILQEFFEQTQDRETGAPWTDDDRARLRGIAERACDGAEAAGLGGKPLLWRGERERLLRDLDLFLDEDAALRSFERLRFRAAEHRFGFGGAPAVAVDLPGGQNVSFRGSIDRVDVAPDGGVRVYDYKSGRSGSYEEIARPKGDYVDHGKRLQLPIYALAAEEAFGTPGTSTQASYWFIDEREAFRRIGPPLDEARRERFAEAVGLIVEGIGGGVFPANPGTPRPEGFGNCTWCGYDRLCQGDRAKRWEQKQAAPEMAAYHALAGDGGDDDGDD